MTQEVAQVRISKWRDRVERVGWTFIESYVGLGLLAWISDGVNLSLLHQLYASLGAAVVATVKVLIAQRTGTAGSGDALPGGITEKPGTPDGH